MSICIDMCKIVHTEGDSIFFQSSGANQEALKKGISICNLVIVDGLEFQEQNKVLENMFLKYVEKANSEVQKLNQKLKKK